MLSKISLQIEISQDDVIEEVDDIDEESESTSTSTISAAKATAPIKPREDSASETSDSSRPVIQKRVSFATQIPAPAHLQFISNPEGVNDPLGRGAYVWQQPEVDVNIFVVDTGADPGYVIFIRSLITHHKFGVKRSILNLKLL